ncbi:CDP-glucose 4,6-dehydratase [Paenibacillus sp. GCM10012306]|uniref:CDP-glucose 4,6-dehydratase n=1 Tax=Paenibacillus sp. GCM10012306 TaxID=3317342 RepID=UPI00361366C5
MSISTFYKGKKVLVTGDTGFKGSWLALWLSHMGAEVYGLANDEGHPRGLFQLCGLKEKITHYAADITDYSAMADIFKKVEPEIVFHLAAQPIVQRSYVEPRETIEVNVMGTVNILECLRDSGVRAAIMVTSDKCYDNTGEFWGYRESDPLGGSDPYSSSKACCELVTNAYAQSFNQNQAMGIATVRSGNVVGGGDWGELRLIPDIIKAIETNGTLSIRNPLSTRPWQHVLDSLHGYLMLAQELYQQPQKFGGAWNFGPSAAHSYTVKEVVEEAYAVCEIPYKLCVEEGQFKEMKLLSLDSTKANIMLNWRPKLSFKQMITLTVDWYRRSDSTDILQLCLEQIELYHTESLPQKQELFI